MQKLTSHKSRGRVPLKSVAGRRCGVRILVLMGEQNWGVAGEPESLTGYPHHFLFAHGFVSCGN